MSYLSLFSILLLLEYQSWKLSALQTFYSFNPHQQSQHGLWTALVDGSVNREHLHYMDLFFGLGIGHLFSPSGSHLSTLLTPVRWILPSKKIEGFILLSVWIWTFFNQEYECIGRVSLLKFFFLFIPNHVSLIFPIFSLDLILREKSSPLSFILSLIFSSIPYSFSKQSNFKIQFIYFFFNLVISCCMALSVSLFALPLNFIIFYIFPYIFPILIAIYFQPFLYFKNIADNLSEFFLPYMTSFYEQTHRWSHISSSVSVPILILLVKGKKMLSVFLFLSLFPGNLGIKKPKIAPSSYSGKWVGNTKVYANCRIVYRDYWKYLNCRRKKTM